MSSLTTMLLADALEKGGPGSGPHAGGESCGSRGLGGRSPDPRNSASAQKPWSPADTAVFDAAVSRATPSSFYTWSNGRRTSWQSYPRRYVRQEKEQKEKRLQYTERTEETRKA